MKVGFIHEHAEQFDITVMCRLVGISRSGYYAALKRPTSQRAIEDALLSEAIQTVYDKHRQVYSSPRIWRQLCHQGVPYGRHRVARLMRQEGIVARQMRRVRATTDSRHDLPVADNVLARDFRATGPNQKWVADITYIRTAEGWLYLVAVMDLFSWRIVGWSMRERIDTQLALDAQQMAIAARSPAADLLQHTDRGSQYASYAYQHLLADHHTQASMSGRGNCYDNAAMESFFHTLKTELAYQRCYRTHDEARTDIFEYIEIFITGNGNTQRWGIKVPWSLRLL